ncbi:MAG: cupin domain-containing protein [Rhodobacteraceae bacterium]|nr:cupin domain-containing protein [Paracoccaceae bacterium]
MKSIITTIAALAVSASAVDAGDIVSLPADVLDWQATSEGAAFAALDGDRFNGEYMAMVRLPAGLASPEHVKTANMYGIVIAGTFLHTTVDMEPSERQPIGPGSYYMIPGGMPHVSACVSDTPCVAFLYQDGAFDFNLVQR